MPHATERGRERRSWCGCVRSSTGARVAVEDDNRKAARITSEMSFAVRLAELQGTEITVAGPSFVVVFPKVET